MTATVEAFPVAHGRCPHCGADTANRTWPAYLIVAAIQAWHVEHGKPPRANDWKRSGYDRPSLSTVIGVFGGWNRAIEAAGLVPRTYGGMNGRKPRWTRELIIEALLDWMASHGHWPTFDDFSTAQPGCPATGTVITHFGTWSKALKAAGYTGKPYARRRRKGTV